MTRTGTPVLRTASTVCSTSATRVPVASARRVASWMTGPSISGSEYGRPISPMSAPPSAQALPPPVPPRTDGNPAGTGPPRARPGGAGTPGVLRAARGVAGAGGHGGGGAGLPVGALEQESPDARDPARGSADQGRGGAAAGRPVTAGLAADQRDAAVRDERME